jgi:hypothetical protein
MENWSPQAAIFIQVLTGTFGLVESPFSTMLQNAKRTAFDAVFFMVNSWSNSIFLHDVYPFMVNSVKIPYFSVFHGWRPGQSSSVLVAPATVRERIEILRW